MVKGPYGAPRGLPRAPDGRGWGNAVYAHPGELRTAGIVDGSITCKVKQISVGDYEGLPGTMGDYV